MLRRFLRRRLAVFGLFLVVLFFGFAYLGPEFYRWSYNQLDYAAFLQPPSAEHWFGTTQNGFDMFALTMRGMQKSLIIGLVGACFPPASRRRGRHRRVFLGMDRPGDDRADRPAAGASRLSHHRHPVPALQSAGPG